MASAVRLWHLILTIVFGQELYHSDVLHMLTRVTATSHGIDFVNFNLLNLVDSQQEETIQDAMLPACSAKRQFQLLSVSVRQDTFIAILFLFVVG